MTPRWVVRAQYAVAGLQALWAGWLAPQTALWPWPLACLVAACLSAVAGGLGADGNRPRAALRLAVLALALWTLGSIVPSLLVWWDLGRPFHLAVLLAGAAAQGALLPFYLRARAGMVLPQAS